MDTTPRKSARTTNQLKKISRFYETVDTTVLKQAVAPFFQERFLQVIVDGGSGGKEAAREFEGLLWGILFSLQITGYMLPVCCLQSTLLGDCMGWV